MYTKRYRVKSVFSAPNVFSRTCPLINRKSEQNGTKKEGCGTNYVKSMCVPYKCSVVYQIPLTCGHLYVGQTSRCLNVCLKEHNQSLMKSDAFQFTSHCSMCGFSPMFVDTKVLSTHRCKVTREVTEAFHIKRMQRACVSKASLSLTNKEFAFLLGTCSVK